VKRLALMLLAGCVDAADPPWQLDHDRIVAVRTEPAGVAAGEVAAISGLLAHRRGPTSEEAPIIVTALTPHELFTAVHYNLDHFEIDGPALATPTPLTIEMRFAGGEVATKIIWLGQHRENPAATATVPDPFPLHEDVDLGPGEWFTSCGTLRGTVLRVDAACTGEVVRVVRDADNGVSWAVRNLQSP
jgi:hypothetical protein